MKKVFHIYTDGACKVHTSKVGAWGYVVVDSETDKAVLEDADGVKPITTSPMMELTAVLEGISGAINQLPRCDIVVHSDSEVVIKGITEWLPNWRSRNWRTSTGRSVRNKSLWKKLEKLTDIMDVSFKWVKGHDGDRWNEYAHTLADNALKRLEQLITTNNITNVQ